MTVPPCAANPDLFFPDKTDRNTLSAAQAICDSCRIQDMCLTQARRNDEQFGVWGGRNFGDRDVVLDRTGWPVGLPRTKFRGTRCRKGGHEFTQANTRWSYHNGKLTRACLPCIRARKAEERSRRRTVGSVDNALAA